MENRLKDIAKFLESATKELYATDGNSTYYYQLDNEFAIYVGFGCGFDEEDEFCLHSRSEKEYAICAKVAEWNPSNLEYEWLNMPWNPKTFEVYDNEIAISPNEDYNRIAAYLLLDYDESRELLDNGEVIF